MSDEITQILAEGEGLMVSSFIWLEDVPVMVRSARAGNRSALFSLVLFSQALRREASGPPVACLFCSGSAPLTHCTVVGGLHAPDNPTHAAMFLVCDRCGAGDRDALMARGREAIVGLFGGGIRHLQIHEDVGHA